jgi:hypothetical protein
VSPSSAREGSDATFTVKTVHGAVVCPITVNYSVSGNAHLDSDFTLTPPPNQVTIPAGQSSATITFHALVDGLRENNETATLTLTSGTGYRLPPKEKFKKAVVKIPKNSS